MKFKELFLNIEDGRIFELKFVRGSLDYEKYIDPYGKHRVLFEKRNDKSMNETESFEAYCLLANREDTDPERVRASSFMEYQVVGQKLYNNFLGVSIMRIDLAK